MSFATSSLKEERARAADREALLKEMLLTERDREERWVFINSATDLSRSAGQDVLCFYSRKTS